MAPRNKNKPWFNNEEADRVCSFFEKILVHTEGIWAGHPFFLADFQEQIVRDVFGWMRWDRQWEMWVRQHSKVWMEVPRGNGKSEFGSGCELELLLADGEFGAEVYAGAEDRDQASIVWSGVEAMIALSPELKKMKKAGKLKVIESKKRIVHRPSRSFLQALPRDRLGTGSQGFKVHGAVIDEFHVQRTKAFRDAMAKGMGKRIQPLLIMITTAGDDPSSPAGEEHDYAVKILEGKVEDPSYYVYIKAAPPDCDPFDEKVWIRTNPALGDGKKKKGFLSIETLRQEAREAKEKPTEYNYFLRYRLNLWVRQQTRWIALEPWDATAGMVVEEKLKGRSCYGGLRLAASTDVAALVLDFPDEDEESHDVLCRFWVPEARMKDFDRRTHEQASVWKREGFLNVTEGDVVDYDAILHQVDLDAQKFDVLELAYDRWGATELAQRLDDLGMEVVQFGQGFASMSPPTNDWERLIYDKKYRHGGNPVMRWMFDNVAVERDAAGNIKISMKHSNDTVVGPVAAVMALSRALIGSGGGPSIIVADDEAVE